MKIASAIFKTFFLSLCIIANTTFAYAQTASILPPAKTTFFDNNGKPLTSGKVHFYIPSTLTPKTTWQDAAETIPNTNPVTLDAAGRAIILGDGSYRQIVKDRNGNTIWDQVTSSTGSGSTSPTSTGDGDLVGTIKPWAGMTAPNQYAFTYGQEVSRTTYATLYTAITSSQVAFCNSGSPTINGLTDTTNFWVGMSLEISCVAAGFTTIVSKTSSSIVMAVNANVTANTTATFYPWGRGNGATTFNLPDFRGFTLAGNNIMGGVSGVQLNTTYFGATDPNSSGASGGSQSTTFLQANLPNVNFIVAAGQTISGTAIRSAGNPGAGTTGYSIDANSIEAVTVTGTVTSTGTAASGGSGTPFSRVQPTKTTNYIIKITPDTNSATASGVTSLGSMTGDIACGSGLLCTGNNISVTTVPLVIGSTTITSGTTTRVLYDNAGVLGEYTISGTGNVAMTTSSVFTTPNLGTPSAAVLTNATGLPLATGVTGILSLANGGTNANLTASNGGIFWSNASQAQILAGTATARLPLLSGATAAPVWGAFTLPASAISGGVLCFTSTSVSASSVLQTANAIMLGGGAGVCPSPMASLGTTTTVLHGNAGGAPTFGAIVSADMNITATNCTNQFVSAISTGGVGTCSSVPIGTAVSGLGTGVAAQLAIAVSTAGGSTTTIAAGTSALGTSAITSGTCATVVTTAATNTATTDVITAGFNGDPTAVTGYIPTTTGMLTIITYPTANNVNFKVCNNTLSSITPGAITLNWRVVR